MTVEPRMNAATVSDQAEIGEKVGRARKSCLFDMPLVWIHDSSKQQVEELARQVGLSKDGKLDDLRKRVKEKWTVIEAYLPS
jgi:hypothetical protein